MPPKQKGNAKDAALKRKVQDKRAGKLEQYPAQNLSEINIQRGRLIAKQLRIKNASKYLFPAKLVPLIKEKMALIKDCMECNGQCLPESHVFPAVVPVTDEPPSDNDAGKESESSSNTSQVSATDGQGGDASPSRQVLSALQNMQNPLDTAVPGAAPAQSFVQHVEDLIAPSTTARPTPRLLRPSQLAPSPLLLLQRRR